MGEEPRKVVRAATAEDAATVARLLHDFNSEFGEPTPGVAVLAERLEGILSRGEATILLVGEGPHGLAQLRFRRAIFSDGLDAYLEELYVVPERRGEGLGRALLEAAIEAARRAGATRIEVGTSEDDVAALALYESAGFSNREGGAEGPVMYFYERDL